MSLFNTIMTEFIMSEKLFLAITTVLESINRPYIIQNYLNALIM